MKTVMECPGWERLTCDARLLVLVLALHGGHVETPMLKRYTGLEFSRLKPAFDLAMGQGFAERSSVGGVGGARLHTLMSAETALATVRPLRKVKDEDKLPPGFVRLWSIHPNGSAKQEAIAEYVKINPDDELLDTMVAALAQQCRIWASDGTPRNKVPHLRTWLHNKRWTDEIRTGAIGTAVSAKAQQNAAAVEAVLRQRGLAVHA